MELSVDLFRRRLIGRWLKLPPALNDVKVERDVRIPMSDGITLLADHYIPKAAGVLPTILIRSPWGHDWSSAPFSVMYMFIAQRFAERGYHVVLQDTRPNKDAADGGWLVNEEHDGKDTLDWIGRQPWFDGNLGMWGASILGYMEWAAAVRAPPFLQALVPVTTASQWYTMVFPDGAFAFDTALRLSTMTRAAGKPMREIIGGGKKASLALKAALDHLPLSQADAIANGKPDPSYQNWFAQSHRDDLFWRACDLSARVPEVRAAVHLIAGWHDIFLREQLADYAALSRAGRAPFLTIGPWHHTSPDLAFQSVREALAWFDAHLRRRDSLRDQPVRIAVLGGTHTTWRDFSHWPPPTRATRYWLHSQGRLLGEPPNASSSELSVDHYRYDPSDPTPSIGGPLLDANAVGMRDNRALEARSDVVCYTSPALEMALEIIGSPRLTLYGSSSLDHTDFFGRVCDVDPEGRSMNVCDGLVRIEPGKGQRQPDGNLCIEIKMGPVAYHFQKGHCIRLQVSSGAHPRWSRNPGTGETMSTATQMVAADQTIYHDREHPSALVLPVVAS